ncbi:MAG: hypothetical protein JO249_12220 [Acidobacteria bacterium]|nr:hypothetical protein [Acidobacteriota bacterium]
MNLWWITPSNYTIASSCMDELDSPFIGATIASTWRAEFGQFDFWNSIAGSYVECLDEFARNTCEGSG